MSRDGVQAVVFDAVGTLLFPDPPAPAVYARVGRRHGSRLTAEEIGPRFAAAFAREEDADRGLGLRTSEGRELERWRRIVAGVLDDVADLKPCFEELFEHFARPDAWRCDPEAGPVLDWLAGRGHGLALASNYDSRLRRVAAGRPELRPLHHLVISSEVGWRKPAREFFVALGETLGREPGQLLFVGDDPANDYDGARAAGLHAVLLDPTGTRSVPAGARIARLSELRDRLGGAAP